MTIRTNESMWKRIVKSVKKEEKEENLVSGQHEKHN